MEYGRAYTVLLQRRALGVLEHIILKITSAGILEQSFGARNRVGIGLSYRPARLHRLAESILWKRFLKSLKIPSQEKGIIAASLGPPLIIIYA